MPTEATSTSSLSSSEVPPGKIAVVVTHLEMLARPEQGVERKPPADFAVARVPNPDVTWYRGLYRAVGEEWLWYSRLAMDDAELAAIIQHPGVEVYRLTRGGSDIGLLELDFRQASDVELVFFGVVADAIGTGAAHALMRFAIDSAWRDGTKRFWVHTCTLDHPRAVGFYERSGFRAFKREIEIDDDPRLTGILPRGAAPWCPIVE